MELGLGSEHQRSQDSGPSGPRALWPVDLKLTHLDWNPEATLIHFQGQYLTICDLDYNILQGEIQNTPKAKAAVDIGEFCLVEDLTSARWYRGRVQNRKNNLFEVFLIDHGNVLSVDIGHISSCSNDLFMLPPKIVCGFLANVLVLQGCCHSVMEKYFSSLIGKNVTGYIQALLPHKVLLLEAPDINNDLVKHGFGRHVDTDTFLVLVEMLTEVPLKQNIQTVPDLLIEKPRGQEFCFKPYSLQEYKDILSFSGSRLSCGTRAKVRVTAAVNPGLFYCQNTNIEADLKEMSEKLAALCEYKIKDGNYKTPENLGQLCSVKSKDGKWYRGFVQYLPVNSQVRVLFIDYGYSESVKVENVHSLPPEFCLKPVMGFPCALSSLSDQDETVKTQQLSFLKAGLLGGVLEVEINRSEEEHHPYSITVLGAEDNRVKSPDSVQRLTEMDSVDLLPDMEKNSSPGGYLYYETIMSEALDKSLAEEEVQVDSVFVGYVEHVQSPTQFWIRTQKRNDEFEEMMTKITNHYSQVKLDEDVLGDPEPGTVCCALYEEDMHFYRGVVTDNLEHGAEVFFIDFGNIEKVPKMLIKNIPETLASKSPFALSCSLANIVPLDEVWTSDTCDFFRRAVSNKALLIHVVQIRKNKFVVDLHEMGSDSDRSITELLISSQHADYSKAIPRKFVVQNTKQKRKCYSMPSNISRNPKRREDCKEEEQTCKSEAEKPLAPASFKTLTIKPGSEFPVCCSYISSPSDFWCQRSDKVPTLQALMRDIQDYYSTHTVPLQPGVLCCVVKSPQDGRWYRAFITETLQSSARVMLVDYGFTIQVKVNSLQAILPEYVDLEGQAFRCSLYNLIEPVDPKSDGDWSPNVCNFLRTFVNDSADSLKCKVFSQLNVKNKGLCNVMDLCNTQTQQNITDVLVEQSLARKATASTKQLSALFPESFVFSSYDLSPGNVEQVFITHVSSQWEVYCHLEKNTHIINELETKLSEESKKMVQASTKAVVRNLCLAKYLDGKWYRGLAHPVQSPLHVCVYFVDYGNTIIAEKTHVIFISRDSIDLLYTPMQGMRFSLTSVSKEVLYADVKEWLNRAVLNKQVRAVIVGKNDDGSFDVELFDGDVNINEKVKELILSLSPKPKTVLRFDTSSIKPKNHIHTGNMKMLVKYKSQPNRQTSSTSNAHRGTRVRKAAQKKKDNVRNVPVKAQNKNIKAEEHRDTNVKTQKTMTNPQIEQHKESHDTTRKQPQLTEKTEIPQISCLPSNKVSTGFRAKSFISHIDSVDRFFLQLSEDESDILKMVEDLNSSVFRDSLTTCASLELKINDLVLAEYEGDGGLYRSVVKDYEGSSSLKVEFVDYGNSAVLGKEKIYSIPKDYLSQPQFSIMCSLLNASAHGSNASFTDAVMDKPLMVDFVRQCGSHWEVMVEVLDGAVSVEHDVAVESGGVPEKEEEVAASEVLEEVRSCEEICPKIREDEATECERLKLTGKDESTTLTPKQTSVTLLAKRKGISNRSRCRTTKNKSDSTRNRRKTLKSVVKGAKDTDAVVPPTIHTRDTESGKVLSVQSNGNFYVRLNKSSNRLAALETYIADKLQKCETVPEEDVKEGLKCLVQLDNQWHRAVVQHVAQSRCQVLLMDHGITEEIPIGSLRRQCTNLIKIQSFAVLCRMNCLGFSEREDDYPKLCCETLKPMIGKEVKLLFVCYSETDHLWMVEIVVNGLFLIHQISASLQQNEEMITQSPTGTQNEAPGLDTDPPQQLVFAPVHVDKEYSGFTAAVTTPSEFCVVLEDFLVTLNKVSIILDDLPELMVLPEAKPIPGTCCMLKSASKSKWCRAEIVHSDAIVVLNLVDYGHCECLLYEDRSKLKRLPENIMKLPKVAYPCILRGVKPIGVNGQWTDEAAFFFQECLYQKNLQIFFKEFVSNTHWKVDILVDGVHVAKELVDAGHASYMDIMLELRFQERSPCKRRPHSANGEEEHDEEEAGEGAERKSHHARASDEVEGRMMAALGVESGSSQCVLI